MQETISYILKQLTINELNFRTVSRLLNKQNKFNRKVTTFMVLSCLYIIKSERRSYEQQLQIKKLQKEIDEMKGE